MRIVVALGGNALLERGQPMTAEQQRKNVRVAAAQLAPVAEGNELVVSHGNGPQVGLLALQAAAYEEVEAYPLDVLGAQTEGMIGYMIEQELGNILPVERPFATILTMVEVDPHDPAFDDPTKFIGGPMAGLRLNEVGIAPAAGTQSFVELRNPTAAPIDPTGATLQIGASSIALTTADTLAPGAVIQLETAAFADQSGS